VEVDISGDANGVATAGTYHRTGRLSRCARWSAASRSFSHSISLPHRAATLSLAETVHEHEMRRHIEEPGEWLRDALAQEESAGEAQGQTPAHPRRKKGA